MFEKWWMLQFMVLHNINNSNLTINLSNKHMKSSLQILSLKNINVIINSNEYSNEYWLNLGFLRIDNGLISMNWKVHNNKLNEIKYLSFEGATINNISTFVSDLDLSKLEYLSLKNAINIKQLPFDDYALENKYFENIKYINFVNINDFNIKLLSLPKLKQYIHYLGNIIISDNQNHSIKYNNGWRSDPVGNRLYMWWVEVASCWE